MKNNHIFQNILKITKVVIKYIFISTSMIFYISCGCCNKKGKKGSNNSSKKNNTLPVKTQQQKKTSKLIKTTIKKTKTLKAPTSKSPLRIQPTEEMINNFKTKTADKTELKGDIKLEMILIHGFEARNVVTEKDKWFDSLFQNDINDITENLMSIGYGELKDNIKIFTSKDNKIIYVFFTDGLESFINNGRIEFLKTYIAKRIYYFGFKNNGTYDNINDAPVITLGSIS